LPSQGREKGDEKALKGARNDRRQTKESSNGRGKWLLCVSKKRIVGKELTREEQNGGKKEEHNSLVGERAYVTKGDNGEPKFLHRQRKPPKPGLDLGRGIGTSRGEIKGSEGTTDWDAVEGGGERGGR